jgi:F0F1-type ATP synthase assembly protein I
MQSNESAKGQGNEPKQLGLFLSLRLAWSLGYIIAIPAVVFGFGGAYMDKYWGTSPNFLLIGFALACLLSMLGVYRKVKEILGAS